MPTHFDIRPVVQKYSALPIDRLRIVSKFEDVGLPQIRRGIIFIFAAWSGPSIFAFRKFTEIMSALKTDSIDLIVLDIDFLTAESATNLFGNEPFRLGGSGEVAWIRDGIAVAHCISLLENEQRLRQHTQALLGNEHNSEG